MATEKHDSEEIVGSDNHVIGTDKKISRRGLLSKAAIGVPLALTLAHKPAFGAICSVSGFQSVSPSGAVGGGQVTGAGCGGFSPGGWKSNGFKLQKGGGPDGNRDQWMEAGYMPNPREEYDDPTKADFDGHGTKFFDAFGYTVATSGAVASTDTLHDLLLNNPGSLESHAIANFLNAHYFDGYRLSPDDVIGLYDAYNRNSSTYVSSNGTTVNMANFYSTSNGLNGLKGFFDQYHPSQYKYK